MQLRTIYNNKMQIWFKKQTNRSVEAENSVPAQEGLKIYKLILSRAGTYRRRGSLLFRYQCVEQMWTEFI